MSDFGVVSVFMSQKDYELYLKTKKETVMFDSLKKDTNKIRKNVVLLGGFVVANLLALQVISKRHDERISKLEGASDDIQEESEEVDS